MHPAPSLLEAPPKHDERSSSSTNSQTPSPPSGGPPSQTPQLHVADTPPVKQSHSRPGSPSVSTKDSVAAAAAAAVAAAAAASALPSASNAAAGTGGGVGPSIGLGLNLGTTPVQISVQPVQQQQQQDQQLHLQQQLQQQQLQQPQVTSQAPQQQQQQQQIPTHPHSHQNSQLQAQAQAQAQAQSHLTPVPMTVESTTSSYNSPLSSAPVPALTSASLPPSPLPSSLSPLSPNGSPAPTSLVISVTASSTDTIASVVDDASVTLAHPISISIPTPTPTPTPAPISMPVPISLPVSAPVLHHGLATPINDAIDVSNSRRPSRRRTGPLSQQQREKAALIRKLGACMDCRRRRVACNPSHHNMTWEDAIRKYHRSHSPAIQDISILAASRALSPAPNSNSNSNSNANAHFMNHMTHVSHMNVNHHHLVSSPNQSSPALNANENHSISPNVASKPLTYTHDVSPSQQSPLPQDMDLDPSPLQQALRTPLGADSRIRTPLPTGPRLEKTPTPLPGFEVIKSELQNNVAKMFASPNRTRYTAVHALLLYWQDDDDYHVQNSVRELADVLEKHYRYSLEIQAIPSPSEECSSSWRWLSRKINDFAEEKDTRDVLKLVYYNGHTYLDGNREMVLASGIQQILEEAASDTLIIMDAAYFASSNMVRQKGVLELIAAAITEDHIQAQTRCTFTQAITEQLRTQASRGFSSFLSVAELHARILSNYPKLIEDRNPEQETITSFPSPLHLQTSACIPEPSASAPQVMLNLRLAEGDVDEEALMEWMRLIPESVKDVKVEGPFRPQWR
ncbi:hypothetical protein HOO65_070308 [Ceratocystis lukuohia]|uniref:Uncharacterized protein n=1 Tax=Ceratocystis lukuohia TaxID=2019550 RepID=A0ABR4MC51_9PEZI